ncbi:MAG: TonB-dependent receptor [Kordia sp.]|nr:MAG: TonB-dependent receptor [Kordia sp.]
MKNLLPYILLFLISISYAQEITFKDIDTDELITNVAIYNKDTSKSTVSDLDGKALINNFNDQEIVYFSHISYRDISILKSKIKAIVYLENESDELSEVTLSVSKSKVKKSRVAEKIEVLTKKDIQLLAPQTTADLLAATPGLRVQKSQGGGGSPVIRGFEANRVLLVMDNVRMNNAIYRSGHLQNAITVDPQSLDRTEVIFGPSSVIYGSDALGGIVHFYTRTPKINNNTIFSGSSNTRYSSANTEFTQSFSGEFSLKKWASYTAFSVASFGDLKMGKNRTHGYDQWGLVPYYSDNNNQVFNDTPIINDKPHIQKNSGYNQFDILQKINIETTDTSNLILNFQLSESTNIPRFDKLTELKSGSLKFAEWYYGPQKRLFFSPQYQFSPNYKWLNSGTVTAAYQNVKESRIKRKYGKLERTHQEESVDVFSLNTDFKVSLSKNRDLSYGAEFTHNDVNSNSYGELLSVSGNQITGVSGNTIVQSRYPDGGSTYTTLAGYLNYRQDVNTKMTLNTGGRYTYTKLKATFIDQTYVVLPETKLALDNSSFTANIGLTFRPSKLTRFNAVVSSGFRSPNIDDVGKIREKSGLLTVPNVNLRPEYAYNGELGITKFFKNKRNQVSVNGFYTLLDKYISRTNFVVANDNSTTDINTVMYDGEEVTTIANVNGGTAYIFGGTLDASFTPIKNITLKGNITYTKGKTNDTDSYLPSISPLFSSIGIAYQKSKIDAGLNWKYTAKKNADEYSPGGEDNLSQSPLIDPDTTIADDEYYIGTPSWNILNAAFGFQVNKTLKLQLGLDNIFDVHYKEFASGISSSGRNFKVSMNLKF